jgi:hypothetical protein
METVTASMDGPRALSADELNELDRIGLCDPDKS